jgi:ribonuclease D
VQVATVDEAIAIDPFATDMRPLAEILANPAIVKILHAAENDIPLLATASGQPVRNVFDTQIAAAFLGYGTTPAYTTLVERICGVALSKTARYTDWSVRPLSDGQISYALDDVRYLLPVATTLRESLIERGRDTWAARAIDDMCTKSLAPRDRARLYLKLGPFKGMTSRQLAILREVAAWRDLRAAELNQPLQSIAPDEALRQIAFEPPRTAADVERLRGLQRVGNGMNSLLAAVKHGRELPAAECPPPIESRLRDERAETIAALIATVLRVRANDLQIAPSLIANREQIEELVEWSLTGRHEPAPEIALPRGWRYDAVGQLLLAVLDGHYQIGIDINTSMGVTLAPTNPDHIP